MRTFSEIIEQAGRDTVSDRLGLKPHQPRDWSLRDRIPAEYWEAIAAQGWASLEELAAIAAKRVAA